MNVRPTAPNRRTLPRPVPVARRSRTGPRARSLSWSTLSVGLLSLVGYALIAATGLRRHVLTDRTPIE